ncbi:hypothetical protein J6590_018164 [Homalodisca vitripennis]|nr:hypothetical protein J6590_018164 [Homalodisca vitripennis]
MMPETFIDKTNCNEQQQNSQYTTLNVNQQPKQKEILKVYQPSIETAPCTEFQSTNILKNYQYPQQLSPDVHQLEKYEYNPDEYIKVTQDSFQQASNYQQQLMHNSKLGISQVPTTESTAASQRFAAPKHYQPFSQGMSSDAVNQHRQYEFNPDENTKLIQDSSQQTPNYQQQPMHNSKLGISQVPTTESTAASQRFAAPKHYQPFSQGMSSDAVNQHRQYEFNPDENTKLIQDSSQQTPNYQQQPMYNSKLGISQKPTVFSAASQRFELPGNYQSFPQGMSSDAVNQHRQYEFNPDENTKLIQDSSQQTPNYQLQPMHNSKLGISQKPTVSSAASQRFALPGNYQSFPQGMSSDAVNQHNKYEYEDSFQQTQNCQQQPMHNSKLGMPQIPTESSAASQRFAAPKHYQPFSQGISADAVNHHRKYEFNPDENTNLTQHNFQQFSKNEQQNVQVTPYGVEQQKHSTVSVSPNPTFVQAFIPQTFQNYEDEDDGEFSYPTVSKQIQTGAIKIIRGPVTE